jgi:hypothetical protein
VVAHLGAGVPQNPEVALYEVYVFHRGFRTFRR